MHLLTKILLSLSLSLSSLPFHPSPSSLTGMSPFLGDDDMETIQNISSGEYEYPDPEEDYEDISDLAKGFIDSLLVLASR